MSHRSIRKRKGVDVTATGRTWGGESSLSDQGAIEGRREKNIKNKNPKKQTASVTVKRGQVNGGRVNRAPKSNKHYINYGREGLNDDVLEHRSSKN